MPDRDGRAVQGSALGFAACVVITLTGLLLRLPSLGNSLFGDELSTYSIVAGHGLGSILHTLDGHSVDLTPPLYFALAWVAGRLGSSPELLRLFSLLAGTATIPLTYRIGIRTVGQRAAISGALLVALSPFLIFYSTEARAYAVVMFLVLASTLALLEAIRVDRARYWIAYAGLSCAAMYTHYTAVFILGAQLGWALVTHRNRWRGLIGANAAAAIGFVPWLPTLSTSTGSFGTKVFGILEPFGPHALAHDLSHWAIGHPYLQLSAEPGTLATALILGGVALVLALAAGTVRGAPLSWRPALSSPAALPVLLALAMPAGLALYSTVAKSVWDMRNLISAWPYFALGLGALLALPRHRLGFVAVGLVSLGFAIGAARLLSSADQRPDYGAAARVALRGAREDPVAIVTAPTPGPYAAMDAAFAFAGAAGRPLLRIGVAPIRAVLRAPPYAFLPATPARTLAAQTALTGAGADGEVFVVAPGAATLAQLLRPGKVDGRQALGPEFGTGTTGALLDTVFIPLSAYLRAILPRFAPVQTIRLPGFLRLSVYVFRRR